MTFMRRLKHKHTYIHMYMYIHMHMDKRTPICGQALCDLCLCPKGGAIIRALLKCVVGVNQHALTYPFLSLPHTYTLARQLAISLCPLRGFFSTACVCKWKPYKANVVWGNLGMGNCGKCAANAGHKFSNSQEASDKINKKIAEVTTARLMDSSRNHNQLFLRTIRAKRRVSNNNCHLTPTHSYSAMHFFVCLCYPIDLNDARKK